MGQCSIDACSRDAVIRGWCRYHYGKWRLKGDPMAATRAYATGSTAERLWSKLERQGECLVFTGWRDSHGYGRFKVDGKMRKPHRVAYELWVSPIPATLFVCHHCDNPSCCNPDHLFLGTQQDNVDDMLAKGRGNVEAMFAASDRIGPSLRRRAEQRRRRAAEQAGVPADFKRCSSCGEYLPPTSFGPNRGRPDGLQTYCRPCNAQRRSRK